MNSHGAYSLKQERLAAERQQAIIRLLLSLITAIVLIKFYLSPANQGMHSIPDYSDAPQFLSVPDSRLPHLSLGQLVTIISLFITYSVGMLALLKFCPSKLKIMTALSSIVEIMLITFLFATTAWTGIPFYLWYFSYVVSVASRYGLLHSILALSASIVSFTTVACIPQNSGADPILMMGFTGFLLVLAMMFGQISERQLRYQASLAVVNEFRQDLAGLANSKEIIDLLLTRTRELLNVEKAFFLPASRGSDGTEAIGLRSVGTDPVLLSTFREEGGIWNVEAILTNKRPLMSNRLNVHNALPKATAEKLGLRNLAAAPLMVRGASVGVVYAANRRDKRLNNSDLQLLALAANQAAPVVENAILWERLTEAATSEERLRFARDLHDNFLQTLAAIKLHLERCKILVDKDADKTKDGIDTIHQIATRGLAEVRYYLSELRMMGPEPSRFREAVKRCAEEAAIRGGFEVEVNIEPIDNPIPPATAVAAFQIVRELLNNAVNHSSAKHVKIDVQYDEEYLTLTVEDDGVGFETVRVRAEKASAGHLGLVGVEERARQAHGTFEITSKPGSGTKATASLAI